MQVDFWDISQFNDVWQSPSCRINDICYASPGACSSDDETYEGIGFFFYRKGHFDLKLRHDRYTIDPTCLVINNDGDSWQVSLEADVPVACTEILMSDQFVCDIATELNLSQNTGNHSSFCLPQQIARTSAQIEWLHAALLNEIRHRQPGFGLLVESLVTSLCIVALRQVVPGAWSTLSPAMGGLHRDDALEKIERAKQFMADHLNEDITLDQIAENVNMSPFHFLRFFKRETGQTPYRFTTNLRINNAKTWLLSSSKSVAEIAIGLGYSNPSHFSRVFRRKVGKNPNAFRRRAT